MSVSSCSAALWCEVRDVRPHKAHRVCLCNKPLSQTWWQGFDFSGCGLSSQRRVGGRWSMGVIWFLCPVPDPLLTPLTQSACVAWKPVPGGCAVIGRGVSGLPGHLKITQDIFHSDGFSLRSVAFLQAAVVICREGLKRRREQRSSEDS